MHLLIKLNKELLNNDYEHHSRYFFYQLNYSV